MDSSSERKLRPEFEFHCFVILIYFFYFGKEITGYGSIPFHSNYRLNSRVDLALKPWLGEGVFWTQICSFGVNILCSHRQDHNDCVYVSVWNIIWMKKYFLGLAQVFSDIPITYEIRRVLTYLFKKLLWRH